MSKGVGILGVGVCLPETVRKNDWWSASTIERWKQKRANRVRDGRAYDGDEPTDGVRRVIAAMAKHKDDPFQGAIERRVLGEDEPLSRLETAAARDAMQRAGVAPGDVDLLIEFGNLPDALTVPNAFQVHQSLGLSDRCFTVGTDATCNTFLTQLELAEAMVRAKKSRCALIVQGSCFSRLAPADEPFSAWYGDGAAAAVIGPVAEGAGILGSSHDTDSAFVGVFCAGVAGKKWWEEGRVTSYSADPDAARRLLLGAADCAKKTIDRALARADVAAKDVTFYGGHPASPWFVEVTRTHAGLDNARTVDTFPWAGNLGSANIPLVLATAQREGLLRAGDLVALYGGGAGGTHSSAVLRWV